jgi:hypothetical protein
MLVVSRVPDAIILVVGAVAFYARDGGLVGIRGRL